MATFSTLLLSGSTNGNPLLITATTVGGAQIVHTCVAGATSFDCVWVYASNCTGAMITLNLHVNDGAADPGDFYVRAMEVPARSPPIPILTGQRMNGGEVLEAWSSATGITLSGGVDRSVP